MIKTLIASLWWYVALPIALAGCGAIPVGSATPACPTVPTPKAQVIDKSCDWAKPIIISKQHDVLTDETAAEILHHNQKYDEVCGTAK